MKRPWWTYLIPGKWLEVPNFDPWADNTAIEHDFEHVSRHSIAETGLICPRCQTLICPQGSFRRVVLTRRGEAVRCNGKREVNEQEMTCNALLFASPDTEHGDHLLWDQTPISKRENLFYKFVRISEKEVLERTYGKDVKQDKDGTLSASGDAPVSNAKPEPKYFFEVGHTYIASNGRLFHITKLSTDQGAYRGWAWGVFAGAEAGPTWHVDHQGLIHRDMIDPTLANNISLKDRITHV